MRASEIKSVLSGLLSNEGYRGVCICDGIGRFAMKIKLLEHYLRQAMAKSRAQHRKISTVLAEGMPEVCAELRRMVTAEDSSTSDRKFAITMLENFWRTLVMTSQSENRTAIKRLQTTVRAKRVKVAETQAALKVHQVRAETDKKLAAMEGN